MTSRLEALVRRLVLLLDSASSNQDLMIIFGHSNWIDHQASIMVVTGASKAASARVGTCSSRGILCHYLPSAPRSSHARSSRASAAFALKRTSTIASRRGVSSATPTRAPGVVFAASGRSSEESDLPLNSVSVVLLAGGVGKRMGAPLPKQYIQLGGKEIALYSFEVRR